MRHERKGALRDANHVGVRATAIGSRGDHTVVTVVCAGVAVDSIVEMGSGRWLPTSVREFAVRKFWLTCLDDVDIVGHLRASATFDVCDVLERGKIFLMGGIVIWLKYGIALNNSCFYRSLSSGSQCNSVFMRKLNTSDAPFQTRRKYETTV